MLLFLRKRQERWEDEVHIIRMWVVVCVCVVVWWLLACLVARLPALPAGWWFVLLVGCLCVVSFVFCCSLPQALEQGGVSKWGFGSLVGGLLCSAWWWCVRVGEWEVCGGCLLVACWWWSATCGLGYCKQLGSSHPVLSSCCSAFASLFVLHSFTTYDLLLS